MQKACRALAETAGRFLFIGISEQIVLGICWMIRSFGIFPEFGDSYLWLATAGTFVCDDYMGIGYPLFLMLAKGRVRRLGNQRNFFALSFSSKSFNELPTTLCKSTKAITLGITMIPLKRSEIDQTKLTCVTAPTTKQAQTNKR